MVRKKTCQNLMAAFIRRKNLIKMLLHMHLVECKEIDVNSDKSFHDFKAPGGVLNMRLHGQ